MRHLKEIACARSGDKGEDVNIAVICRSSSDYPLLQKLLTEESVKSYFSSLQPKKVERFLLPKLHALNFVLYGVLKGGGSLNLSCDAQGKALGQSLLLMEIE